MNRLITGLLLLGLVAPVTAADSPRAIVQEMTDRALAVLADKSLGSEEKRHRLEAIAEQHTDFETMSKLVLGRNWSQFSPAQQTEFVKEFKEHLSVTYGRNIENYQNEKVEIVGDREEARGDWTVKSKILRGGGANDVLVDYRLRREGDAWRVIDIVIERVSLVANFRSQLQEVVTQGGPTKVIELLREKNARGEPIAS
jgi:phospholipid transport system substrate-binding protein